jgi:hypothetical protein
MFVKMRWAPPRIAAVEGLPFRDMEPDMAANDAAFLPSV